jgi:predicted peptidase
VNRGFAAARVLALAMLIGAAGAGAAFAQDGPAVDPAFLERVVVHDGVRHRYRVFVPRGGATPRPVILFLHGSGERGTDNAKQTHVGLGPVVAARAADFPAIVVFPQASEGGRWSGDDAAIAMKALDAAIHEFGGDPARVHLTGLSRGGYGVYELALAHPDRFAALVPVCGGLRAPAHRADLYVEGVQDGPDPYADLARRLRDVPLWAFHGAKDDVVPPENSRLVVGALLGAGARDVRYTEFPEANHNAWDAAYAHAPLWDWLFSQRRAGGAPDQ